MPINWPQIYAMNEDDSLTPKRGDEIFAGTDYPTDWSGFIGQTEAKEQLMVNAASARARGARIEHTMLASGIHGVGKTTLATLLAFNAGAGFLQTTGPLDVNEARKLMLAMQDHDVLFIDEAHLLVQGGRNKADWLLPYMTEGTLYTARGAEKMPDVAIVAATTDVGKLPMPLLSRFMCTPTIEIYSPAEQTQIAANLVDRMGLDLGDPEAHQALAVAADGNPRMMRRILTAVRDLSYAFPATHPNLDKAFRYAGVSADGLTMVARDILLTLLLATNHTSSIDTISQKLGEPGPLRHDERALLQRGLIDITPRGRVLTDAGIARARREGQDRMGQVA